MSQPPGPIDAPPPGCPAHRGGGHTPAGPPLYGPEFAADPDRTYDKLRAQGPAAWVELSPGVDAMLVTSYDAALKVLRHPNFVKDARRWRALNEGRVTPDNPVIPMMGWRPSLLFTDGDRHRRLRTSVTDALAKVDPVALRGYVEHSAVQLIDEFAQRGSADLVSEYADRLPLLVFTQLFGAPDSLVERMVTACAGMIDASQDAQQAGANLAMCLGELIAIKRQHPGRDLTSWLLAHPARLSDEEMIHQLVVLIGAGSVPTTAWIASATMLLLTDDRFAGEMSGGSMPIGDALTEVLWTLSPMSNFCFHYAIDDYELKERPGAPGVLIPKDVPVLISHAAANTDPSLAGAHVRKAGNHAHLAWSAGPHVCPAQDPANVIATTAIEKLLDLLPDMDLAVPVEHLTWRPGPFHRTLTALPVRFPALSSSVQSTSNTGEYRWTTPSSAPAVSTPPEPISTARPTGSGPRGPQRVWSSLAKWWRGQ